MDLFNNVDTINVKDLLSLQLDTTSKGNQRKWYDTTNRLYIKEQLYYQEKYWRDDLVEIIAYELAKQMFFDKNDIIVVQQHLCKIQDIDNRVTRGIYSVVYVNRKFGQPLIEN